MMLAAALAALTFPFHMAAPCEAVAEVTLSSPGSDWAVTGREAAVANIYLDGKLQQNVMLYAGPIRHPYRLFLGALPEGPHQLRVERNAQYSAPSSRLDAHGAKVRPVCPGDPDYALVANAPVLYARKNTIGQFTDVPMIVYAERLHDGGREVLQYTVIFSNEDGGTSTRALMARWGRTTDIEYVYRGPLERDGTVRQAIIQGKDHKDRDFAGRREGSHPLLIPITDNNMIGDDDSSPIRYQIAPVPWDTATNSREGIMDQFPWSYDVMVAELKREGKLREYGAVDGEKVQDPHAYVYFDYDVDNRDSAVNVTVRLKGSTVFNSSLGRLDYAIGRKGWVRTSVELPPGSRVADITEVGFECLVAAHDGELYHSGTCHVGDARGFMIGGVKFHVAVNADIPSGRTVTVAPRP